MSLHSAPALKPFTLLQGRVDYRNVPVNILACGAHSLVDLTDP